MLGQREPFAAISHGMQHGSEEYSTNVFFDCFDFEIY